MANSIGSNGVDKGDFVLNHDYYVGDKCFYNGSDYRCKVDVKGANMSPEDDTTNWEKVGGSSGGGASPFTRVPITFTGTNANNVLRGTGYTIPAGKTLKFFFNVVQDSSNTQWIKGYQFDVPTDYILALSDNTAGSAAINGIGTLVHQIANVEVLAGGVSQDLNGQLYVGHTNTNELLVCARDNGGGAYTAPESLQVAVY